MKELRTIVKAYRTIDFSNTRVALATVVRVEGSSYRRAGARMLVRDDGNYLGGISGGCLEGDALRRAQKAIGLGYASVVTYDTTQDDDHQVGVGLGCQGIIDVLFTPLDPMDPGNPLEVLAQLTGIRQPACVVTITGGPTALGYTLLYTGDAAFLAAFPVSALATAMLQDLRPSLSDRRSRTMSYGDVQVFIEIIMPAVHVVAYGGNNDLCSLLQMTDALGWDTTIVTNTSRADKSLYTLATRVLDHKTPDQKARDHEAPDNKAPDYKGPDNKAPDLPLIDAYTAVLLMTHDYRTDLRRLPGALASPAPYIGILGPRKRTEKLYADLARTGYSITPAEHDRIYSPAGLDIGAATPEEIALSILAEIRGHFAGRQGMPLRFRGAAIYNDTTENDTME